MGRPRASRTPLSLDLANERAHLGKRALRLTPKAFAVLRHLLERAGRLATKDEILSAVWPAAIVTEGSLATCVREIRRALDDDPKNPTYVETVHRRGYRYVGAVSEPRSGTDGLRTTSASHALLVGRERELAALERALRQTERGERRLMLLAGEPGIGKTALVEHFVSRIARCDAWQIARGQCLEQYGACEPYLPWFDVLNQLARDYGQARLAATLRRCAPMWLAQLPWLIGAHERKQLQNEIAGVGRERMMRELAEALEALSAERQMVVILEDLHWSDPSSIALLSFLARRRRSGPLLLIGTYRPEEAHVASHPLMPLKQELLLHGVGEELRLDFLTMQAVDEYVRARLPGAADDVAIQLHRRTEGNPLFMINVIDYLLTGGWLVQDTGRWHIRERDSADGADMPESLREIIGRQLDCLSHDERVALEGASVAGTAFSAASVAAALEHSVEAAEERLGALARRGSFVRATGRQAWPDGTQSDSYEFIHALYQNVLYDRIGTARRSRMHSRAGERLEAAYGERVAEIAAALALHFERGRDATRAVRYLTQAGENAVRRSAYIEAISLLNQGIDLLAALPEGADRDASELRLRVPLGVCLVNTRGYAAAEVGAVFERAHALCRTVRDTACRYRVLRGLWSFVEQRADLQKARSVAEELLQISERDDDPAGMVEGHRILATTWFHLGYFMRAREHLDRATSLYDARTHSSHAFLYGIDPGVSCLAWQGWTCWYLGQPDEAAASAKRAIELARQSNHPFNMAYALNFAAHLHLCRREPEATQGYAREAVQRAREHGLTSMLAMGQILHGWSDSLLAGSEAGVAELNDGIARWRSTGARLITPYWLCLLAAALKNCGRVSEASSVLDDAVAEAERTDERWFSCELHILRAALAASAFSGRVSGDSLVQARRDLSLAFRHATELESPALQLRAANALSPLLREAGRAHEARELLQITYAAFDQGFETADLAQARTELAHSDAALRIASS